MAKLGMMKKGYRLLNFYKLSPFTRSSNQNEDLIQKVKYFSDKEKFVVLLTDKMKIQENLVWDKYKGELIVVLGNNDVNYATLSKVTTVASHVLVFLIRSIVNPLVLQQMAVQLLQFLRFYGMPFLYMKNVC